LLGICGGICAVLAVGSWLCAATALWPRLRARDSATDGLYFDHIARAYRRKEAYAERLRAIMADNEVTVAEVAAQVWANAWVNRLR
jgi:Family of unknown function (DUF5706)